MHDKISLVIAVKNEEESIARLLDSIGKQSLLPDETIIVDGGSTDNTKNIIKKHIPARFQIRLIESLNDDPGSGRNLGIEKSKYDFIAITDGGIELDANWLKELKTTFLNQACDIVYGTYESRSDTIFKIYSSLAYSQIPKVFGDKAIRSDFIASSLFKKNVWKWTGKFPELRSSEDRIFMERVGDMKFKTAYAPKAKVIWDIPKGPQELFQRFYIYSIGGIKAGRMKDWHYPVIYMYAFALLLLALSLFYSKWFLLFLGFGIIGRCIGLVLERSDDLDKTHMKPIYPLITLLSVYLIDVAMFCGLFWYILLGRHRKQ